MCMRHGLRTILLTFLKCVSYHLTFTLLCLSYREVEVVLVEFESEKAAEPSRVHFSVCKHEAILGQFPSMLVA